MVMGGLVQIPGGKLECGRVVVLVAEQSKAEQSRAEQSRTK